MNYAYNLFIKGRDDVRGEVVECIQVNEHAKKVKITRKNGKAFFFDYQSTMGSGNTVSTIRIEAFWKNDDRLEVYFIGNDVHNDDLIYVDF